MENQLQSPIPRLFLNAPSIQVRAVTAIFRLKASDDAVEDPPVALRNHVVLAVGYPTET